MYSLSGLGMPGVNHSHWLRLVRSLYVAGGRVYYDVIRDVKLIVDVHYLLLLGRLSLTVF